MNKLAVLFPGIGYSHNHPLLYYCRKRLQQAGFDVLPITYDQFSVHIKGNRQQIMASGQIAGEQAMAQLAEVDLTSYEQVVFIAKSIGTIAAVKTAATMPVSIKHVLLTPLEETFQEEFEDAIVFHGSQDPWAKTEIIKQACHDRKLPLMLIDKANHSLETGDVMQDLDILQAVMTMINAFLQLS